MVVDGVTSKGYESYQVLVVDGVTGQLLKGYDNYQVLVVDGVVLDGPALRLDLSLPLVLI